MRARDLATAYPTVRMTDSAADAARLIGERHLPGVIVVDEHDHPLAVLPGSQVLRMVIPGYVQDDPALARVLDEEFADRIADDLAGRTVADVLPTERVMVPVVDPGDTVLEIAALMAANRTPVVAVVEGRDPTAPLLGAVTASALLERLVPPPA